MKKKELCPYGKDLKKMKEKKKQNKTKTKTKAKRKKRIGKNRHAVIINANTSNVMKLITFFGKVGEMMLYLSNAPLRIHSNSECHHITQYTWKDVPLGQVWLK